MMRDQSSEGGPLGGRGALWGAAGLIVLLGTVEFVATFASGRPWTWDAEMLVTASWWIFWLPLVPAVGVVARRFHFTKGRRLDSAVAHAAAAIVLSLIHLTLVATVNWEVIRIADPHGTWFTRFAQTLFSQFNWTLVKLGNPYGTWSDVSARFLGMPFLIFDFATYGSVAATLLAAGFARAYHDNELLAERLRARTTALEASVVQAKLDALRMQLNPHFLFNSLNAVSGLVGRGRSADAQEMLGRLGGLLRETLKRERADFTTVAAEVALLNDFLFIEQIRFGDRLTVAVTVAPSALDGAIPTMLLQPLAENAVRHGIEPTMQPGTVSVDVRRSNGNLLVRIEDTGRGFNLTNGQVPHEGIGLANTRARLQQLFGAEASLTVGNRAEGGARLDVRMPWIPR